MSLWKYAKSLTEMCTICDMLQLLLIIDHILPLSLNAARVFARE